MFVVAFLARMVPLFRGGGLRGNMGYDAGVYYAAGDGLVHGRLPYRDFTLLHPPGLMLALAPFAVLGRFTSDHAGFMVACVTFTALGSLNATLVVAIARRLGLSLSAALCGGLVAALWVGSVRAEYLTRLEPLGNFFVLVALYGWARARREPRARWFVIIGVASGAATSVKIWYVVPMIVVIGWVIAFTRSRRTLALTLGAAALMMIAINGVFFLLAPVQMWQMVVASQLGRTRISSSPLTRFEQASSVAVWHHAFPLVPTALVAAFVLIAFVGFLFPARTQPGGRTLVVLVCVQAVLLVCTPPWFSFYSDYLTPAVALVVATAVAGIQASPRLHRAQLRRSKLTDRIALSAGALAVLAAIGPLIGQRSGTPFPGRPLPASVRTSSCVIADSPMALIELNALSRSFAPGCHNWVDVTGRTYGADKRGVPRQRNARWQKDLTHYLLSGDAFIMIRSGTGYSASTTAYLKHRPILARDGMYTIYRGTSPTRR